MHFTEYDTRLAAYAVVVDGDRILLAWYNGSGFGPACWALPGGGVELDESPEEGAVREVREETGYDVELVRLLGVDAGVRRHEGHRPFRRVRVFYEAQVTGGKLGTLEVGGTTDRAAWLVLADLDHVLHADSVETGLAAWRDATGGHDRRTGS